MSMYAHVIAAIIHSLTEKVVWFPELAISTADVYADAQQPLVRSLGTWICEWESGHTVGESVKVRFSVLLGGGNERCNIFGKVIGT
jgi:hypothetical protein